MNAPLPAHALRPAQAYEQAARAAGDVAGQLARELAAHAQGDVLFAAADRGRYATDASIYQQMPVGVFVPRAAADAKTALDICRSLRVPLVPRGAGTSQCGQTVGAGLVLDMAKHVRSVLEVDVQARVAQVEPGIVLDHLNAALKSHGLWYPVDVSTSAQATLGGMAGNNSCGSRSVAYGNMVHNVLGMEAWTADGALLELGDYARSGGRARELGDFVRALAESLAPEIDANWPKVLRRVAGYNLDVFRPQSVRPYTADGSVNLAHLLVGSEGTLALTKSLTLQLAELPRAKVLGVVNFTDFHRCMDSAQHIAQLGDGTLTAIELVDRTMIELALANPAFAPTMRKALIGEPEAILLVEFSGASKEALSPHLRRLVERMGDLGLPDCVVEMPDEAPQKALWEVRKAGLNIMMSLKGDGKPVSFIEDCAVPLEHLAEYTDALTQVFRKHGTRGTWYAHASVGTLHVRPILDMRRDGAPKMRAIAAEASELVRRYKGAYSGEHGDGLCRGEWISWQFGPRITEAFARIKEHLDPQGLLCPQRIVDPPAMDEARLMRFPPSYRVIPLQPALDWSAWNVQNDPMTEAIGAPGSGGDPAHGFAKAAEMCNNNGHCRKFDAGTMCPSYRVTRDEKHLTRGRANTLRLWLSNQLPLPSRGGDGGGGSEILSARSGAALDEVRAAMELCVSCKGCKRECPTGVDMARMKIEFLHHDRKAHGYTLKDRLIGSLPDYAPLAARFAALLNFRNRSGLLARLGERWLGLAAQRSLPEWSRDGFWQQPRGGASRDEALHAERPVALFVDTFTAWFEPENAVAAQRVLEAAGYAVHVIRAADGDKPLCCGRTFLATGMVDRARDKTRALLESALPFAQRGIAIVGLEPSCLFTLRDEALVLGLGAMAQTVAGQALLFEEFLAREQGAGRLEALARRLRPLERPLLVHGHCHQKAFDAVSPLLQVLRLIPQAKPELIETSCCGMAGAFGYEVAHHAVSMQMAELSLLPAIRRQPDAVVVADGTSCRHQIADGAQRQAIHAARLLSEQLA